MANVTFSSPSMSRDVAVHAVAGECGSCLVEVTALSKTIHAIFLTEKEKEMLRRLGRISKAEVAAAEEPAMPPHFRLASPYIIRDEDILAKFAGAGTAPKKVAEVPRLDRLIQLGNRGGGSAAFAPHFWAVFAGRLAEPALAP
ncbi:hypothetical protein [Rhodoblastus sp.]|uniref:hypothetical protein n=1 Tax=Rhodoblastus sp. TaxID=1962975 RepID=UPI00260DB0DB|nr:hypothetical protein [Rhodoblastus sp.]